MILLGDTPPPGLIPTRHRFCRGCGCTEHDACTVGHDRRGQPIGCAWVVIDLDEPTGFCSACAEEHDWDQNTIALLAIYEAPAQPRLVLP